MLVVLDTNIIVSAFWSKNCSPTKVVSMVLSEEITPCFDYRIITEYREVLSRPRFGFSEAEINSFISWVLAYGRSVLAPSLPDHFEDESDKKFYEVAKFCNATLITGNLKHFPKDPIVKSVAEFLEVISQPYSSESKRE